jgi:hypothetical protein
MNYRRPRWAPQAFTDEAGRVISYGRRWQDRAGNLPPDAAYGRVTHPERFVPVQTVAEALVAYLSMAYDVTVAEDTAFASDLLHEQPGVQRAVRIRPSTPDAAPLTFILTSLPGVVLHAGLLHDFPCPTCGCDACDETAETAANELEAIVMAVVEGRYRETCELPGAQSGRRGRWAAWSGRPASTPEPEIPSGAVRAGYSIVGPDGAPSRRGETLLAGWSSSDRLTAAAVTLARLPEGWQPWPSRNRSL